MKKESPLRSSISLLIGIVIAILALVRGRILLPLLLAVFALWLLWWLLTQALPLWRNNRAYRAKEARLREQTAAANGGGQLADALLCHVNYRITAMLHAAYPNARWEWLADKPSRFAVEGGTARIRVYGIPDFDYADVKLDQKANLDCSLVKLSPLVAGASDTQPPNRQPVNPRVWFETRGRAVLEALVTDLNSRGHSSLTVQENGEVFVQAKENEAEPAKETFLDFPEKVYWPQLVKVLEEEGYAADARDADIAAIGYLHAVQRYFTEKGLHRYRFSTIAWRSMNSSLNTFWRQEQRRQSHEFSYQAAHPPPDDAFDALRARLLLHDLFLLADEEQALLVRHRLHGCSLTETARMEGMSVKRVRHRLKALYRAYFAQKETKQKEL